MHDATNSLRRVIELDKKSGRFEPDNQGWIRFYPDDDLLKKLNAKYANALTVAEEEHRDRFAIVAENIETYRPIKIAITDGQGRALVPSTLAREAADQIIANTVNACLRPRPIFAFDPYFEATYPVFTPVSVGSLRQGGMAIAPRRLPDNTEEEIPDGERVAFQYEVDAETLSRVFQQRIEFDFRERMDFAHRLHECVHNCTIGNPPYWDTFVKRKVKNRIDPKGGALFIDLEDEDEEYGTKNCIEWRILDNRSVLRPNIHQEPNDLPWMSKRDPENTPDDVTRRYELEEFFLIKDRDAADKLSKMVGPVIDESKKRTDESTKNDRPQNPDACDLWEISFDEWLKVPNPDDPASKPVPRLFRLQGTFHRGAGQFVSIFRHPYNHGRRTLVPFTQFLDGSSTVEQVKPRQVVQTYYEHAEIKNAHTANNLIPWVSPTAPPETQAFFAEHSGTPIAPTEIVPGVAGKDWGYERAGADHASLLENMQWNAGSAQQAAKQDGYDSGARVVSHTSPNVVDRMLDRGGQPQVLSLSLLDRGLREVVRLYLETKKQYDPLGDDVPIRDEHGKLVANLPMLYPVHDLLDNFHISLTAADEAITRERDTEEIAKKIALYERKVNFITQIAAAVVDPKSTEKTIDYFVRAAEGMDALFDDIIGPTRTDHEKFDSLTPLIGIADERKAAIEQARIAAEQQAAMGMMNAQNQGAAPSGIPAEETGSIEGAPSVMGGEPGNMGGPANPSGEIGGAPI